MTITYKGLGDQQDADDTGGIRTYTMAMLFTTSSASEGAYHVLNSSLVPKVGSIHFADTEAYLQRRSVTLTKPKFHWTVTLSYSSQFEMTEDPLDEPARLTIDGEKYQEVADTDRNGQAMLNSAGDYFSDPPIMRDRTDHILRVSKNVAEIPIWFLNSQDVVNDAEFTYRGLIFPERTLKIERVPIPEIQKRNDVEYFPLVIEIKYRKATWNAKPLQSGYRQLVGGDLVKIVSEGDGTDLTTPALLDENGAYIPHPVPTDAKYADFEIYNELDFETLPLT